MSIQVLSQSILEKNYVQTGILARIDISINADTTKFDIAAGSGVWVNKTDPLNPTFQVISWSAMTAITGTYVTTASGSWIAIDPRLGLPISSANVVQSPTDYYDSLENVFRIGRLSHFGRTVITAAYDYPKLFNTANDWAAEHMRLGTIRISGGEITANGANLKLNKAAISTIRIGSGVNTLDEINFPYNAANSQFSMIPGWRSATANRTSLSAATTDLDPTHYDDGDGTLGVTGNNQFVNIYIYFFPNIGAETVFAIYGIGEFANLAAAILGIKNGISIKDDIAGGHILACISVKNDGSTDLAAAIAGGSALITSASNFGTF